MTFRYRMQLSVLILLSIACCIGKACEVDDIAVYKVQLTMMLNEETFPKEYPGKAVQWSQVFGQSHNRNYALFRVAEVSRSAVHDFLQFGTAQSLDPLMGESEEEPRVYDQFIAPAVEEGVGKTEGVVFVDGEHSLVSIISKMLPSDRWFVGVDSLNLCMRSTWVDQIALDLEPLDAGMTDAQQNFIKPVEKLPLNNHNFVGSKFYNRNPRQNHPIAKVEFTKIKEYSTIELNNLARRELLAKLKLKNAFIKFPGDSQADYSYKQELTTKNSLDQLKDLEEDPVGTPRPYNPENNVFVVTKAPIFENSENMDDSAELDNMDEVVLAVASGKRLGLGKHLPRHFRSRLHHAVNRNRGKDCVVSAWSDWSPCKDPCSQRKRVRSVVQRKRGNGRECPPLVQKQTCGRCVRGDGDYSW